MSVKSKILAKMFNASVQAVNKWKRDGRPAVMFFEKYFSDEEILEFLETGRMDRMERNDTHIARDVEEILFVLDDLARHMCEEKMGKSSICASLSADTFRDIAAIASDLAESGVGRKNAKGKFLSHLKANMAKKSGTLAFLSFVEKELSDIETYALIKHANELL